MSGTIGGVSHIGLAIGEGTHAIAPVVEHGLGHIGNQIKHIEHKPFESANNVLGNDGFAQIISSMAGNSALGVLGGLSVIAGWQQRKSLTKQIKEYDEQIKINCGKKIKLGSASGQSQQSNVIQAKMNQLDIKKQSLMNARKYAQNQKSELGWSIPSGAFMAFKGFSELGTQITLGIKSVLAGKSFMALGDMAQVGLAASAASVVGLAGTFATPLIGICSSIHAGKMWQKSKKIKVEIKANFDRADDNIKAVFAPNVNLNIDGQTCLAKACDLRQFMLNRHQKNNAKLSTARSFNRNLFGFSAFFTAAASTKAIIVGLALGGIAALASNPVGWGVLLGATVALGIGMAYYGIRAYRANKQQDKLVALETQEHHLVDKDLIVRHAKLQDKSDTQPLHAQKIAAATLNHLQTRESDLRDFLDLKAGDELKIKSKKIEEKLQGNFDDFKKFVHADIAARIEVLNARVAAVESEIEALKPQGSQPQQPEQKYLSELEEVKKSLDNELEKLEGIKKQSEDPTNDPESNLNFYRKTLKFWNPKLNDDLLETMKSPEATRALAKYLSKSMVKDLEMAKGVLHATLVQAFQTVQVNANQGQAQTQS